MNIKTADTAQVFSKTLDLLLIPMVNKKLPALPLPKGSLLALEIQRHAKLEELEKNGNLHFYPALKKGTTGPKKIILIGKDFDSLNSSLAKAKTVGIVFEKNAKETFIEQLILKIGAAGYDPKIIDNEKELTIFGNKKISAAIQKAQTIAESINLVKRLSNTPANLMTPGTLETEAKTLAKTYGLKFQSLGEKEMEKLSMGGILGVSRGSDEEAKLIVVEYNPARFALRSMAGGPKAKKTIALVGKGITFDSGGISIKHSKGMSEMKHDMTGGACVLALVAAASKAGLPYRVIGVVAATENLPSGKALKPGDVITSHSGKTIEVLNTDGEGRLVLSDALSYVQKNYQPKLIVDIATLTSGIIVSLGNDITGAFGNNAKINSQLLKAASEAGENFHFMPLHEKYRKELTSKVADLQNVGKQRSDAIFAALFLQEFVEKKTPWLHLDIAGTAWNGQGATGAIMPTLIKFLEKLKF